MTKRIDPDRLALAQDAEVAELLQKVQQLTEELSIAMSALRHQELCIKDRERELAQARKDSERLNWMLHNCVRASFSVDISPHPDEWIVWSRPLGTGTSGRAAIDDAMGRKEGV